MAGSARRIVVEFIGDGKSLTNELSDMESRTGKFGTILGKVGKAAALGLAAGVGAATVAGVKFAQMAMEDQQSAELMANAMRNNAGATDEQVKSAEAWISAQGRMKGVADDELRPALSALVTSTHDVRKAQELATLAMDVSAARGKSLQSVSEALMKAQNGNVAALSRLGINTKDAAGETITMEQAVQRMATSFGGAAAEKADTLQGRMDRLKLILSETGESIGYKLLPVVEKMAGYFLDKVIPALDQAGTWANEHLLPALRDMGTWIEAHVLPALAAVGTWIRDKVLPAFQGLGTEGPTLFAKVRDIVGQVATTVMHLWAKIAENMLPVFQQLVATFRADVLPTLNKVLDRFAEWWPTISKVVTKLVDVGTTIAATVLPPVIKLAGFLLEKLVPAILDTIEIIAKIIGKAFEMGAAFVSAVGDVAHFVSKLSEKIGNAIGYVKDIPSKVTGALGDLGSLLLNAGKDIIQGLIDGILSKIDDVKGVLHKVTDLIPIHKGPPGKDKILLKPAGIAIIQGLIDGIDQHKVKLQSVLDKLTNYIEKRSAALSAALDRKRGILDAFQGMASSVFGASIQTEADAEGNAPASPLDQLLGFQKQQRARAEQIAGDVNTLVGKGLSKELLDQLVQSGQQGIDQIHALAGATADQIAALNADNAATQKALMEAGLAAVHGLGVDADIKAAERDLRLAEMIESKLDGLLKKQDANTIVQLKIGAHVIHVSLLELKRKNGQDLGLG